MNDRTWQLADLDERQLDLVREAERTLDADYVLVFRPVSDRPPSAVNLAGDLQPAALDDSQLECLQGLEQRLRAVTVAYQRPGA
jgi:hypothetical protein